MSNSPLIPKTEFRAKYPLSWYFAITFTFLVSVNYIYSKIIGENIESLIELLGIGAIITGAYWVSHTITQIELGTKATIKYILWPARHFEYKDVLEVRLPEIIIDSQEDIKLENIDNLEKLHREFKHLEFIGVLRKNCVRDIKPAESKYTFKPRVGNILLGLFSAFYLGNELFEISKTVNVMWVFILAVLFISEVFTKLFGKRKDE